MQKKKGILLVGPKHTLSNNQTIMNIQVGKEA
jgi:hypothetical protein